MKRHLNRRKEAIKKDLSKYARVRAEHRKGRSRKWFFTVGIVGYTNAGKSSLLNSLTGKWVLAENKLFATLGTSVWKLWIEGKQVDDTKYIPWKDGATQKKLYIFNKIDMISEDQKKKLMEEFQDLDVLFVSSKDQAWFTELKERLKCSISFCKRFKNNFTEEPYSLIFTIVFYQMRSDSF